MGGVVCIGLDYAAVKAGLSLAGLDPDPATWAEVQQIEAGAMKEMNGGR